VPDGNPARLVVWTDLEARRLHFFDPVKELDRAVEVENLGLAS
jgi:hypothetical protein